MMHEDYKTVLDRQDEGSSVAEIPAIPGYDALRTTPYEALSELAKISALIAHEFRQKGRPLPANTIEIING
jgi:predicted RNase H-like HicB family nuclease